MTKRLFVGNLSWSVSDEELASLVGQYAEVISARVATDRDTGRSRGFAFVEVPADAAESVITALDGYSLDGRALTVNEARPREERPRRGGGGRPGGYGRSDNRW